MNGLDLDVPKGEVHGLVGANGSGKSTLMRMIAGLVIPTSGSIHINGKKCNPLKKSPIRVGYLPASGRLYSHLSVQQNVEFFAALSGIGKDRVPIAAADILHELGCDRFAALSPDDLSFGMYQKARLARLLVMKPQALLLDEPSTGVDIVGASQLNDLIRGLAETGIPILLATHNIAEIEAYCSRLTILNQGVSAFTGTLKDLHDLYSTQDTHRAIYQHIKDG